MNTELNKEQEYMTETQPAETADHPGAQTDAVAPTAESAPLPVEESPADVENGELPSAEPDAASGARPEGTRPPLVKSKKTAAALIVAGGLAIGTAVTGAVWYAQSPALDVRNYIKNNQLAEAERLYQAELKGNVLQEKLLHRLLRDTAAEAHQKYLDGGLKYADYLEQCGLMVRFGYGELNQSIGERFGEIAHGFYQAYADGTMDYWTARRQLQQMDAAGVTDAAAQVLEELAALDASLAAWKKAETYLGLNRYDQALVNYRQVIPADPHYDEAQTKLAQCITAYRSQVLTQTDAPVTVTEYKAALTLLEEALALLPGDEELIRRQSDLQEEYAAALKQQAIAAAREYADSLNFRAALDVLQDALAEYPNDTELADAVATVKAAYSAYTKKLVANCLASRDYNTAYQYLSEACTLMPEDEALRAMLADMALTMPVDLNRLTPESSNRFEKTGTTAADVFGNTYNGNNMFYLSGKSGDWGDDDLGYVRYKLTNPDTPYTALYGTVVLASESGAGSCTLEFYSNGKRVYATPTLTRTSAPVRVEVPLVNPSELEIRMVISDGGDASMMIALLSNFQLYQ